MTELYAVLILTVLSAIQWVIASRCSTYWSFVVPVLAIFGLVYVHVVGIVDWSILKLTLFIVAVLVFSLDNWYMGRKSRERRRKKELEKMRAYEM